MSRGQTNRPDAKRDLSMRALIAARQAQAAAMRQKAAKERLAKYAQLGDKQFAAQQAPTLRDLQMQNLLESIQSMEDTKRQAAVNLEASLARELAGLAIQQEAEQKADTVRLTPSKGVLDSAKLAAEFQLSVLRDQAMKAAVKTQQDQYQALLARAMFVRSQKLQKVDPEIEAANRAFERTTVNTLTTLMRNNPSIIDILNTTGTKVANVRRAKTAVQWNMQTSQSILKSVIADVNATSNTILAAYTKRFLTESELGGQLADVTARITAQRKQQDALIGYKGALTTFALGQTGFQNSQQTVRDRTAATLTQLQSNLTTAISTRDSYKLSGLQTVETNHRGRIQLYTYQQGQLVLLRGNMNQTAAQIQTLTNQLTAVQANRALAEATKQTLFASFFRAAEARTRSALQALQDAKREMDAAYATMMGLQITVRDLSTRIDPTQTALERQLAQTQNVVTTQLEPAVTLSLTGRTDRSAQLEALRTQARVLTIQTQLDTFTLANTMNLFSRMQRPQKSATLLQAEALLANQGASIAILLAQTPQLQQSLLVVPSRAALDATLLQLTPLTGAVNSSKARMDSIKLSLDSLTDARNENTRSIGGFQFQSASIQNGISVRNVQIRLALFQEQTRFFGSKRAAARDASLRATDGARGSIESALNSLGNAETTQGFIRNMRALLDTLQNTSSSEMLIRATEGMIGQLIQDGNDVNVQLARVNLNPSLTAFNLANGQLQTATNGVTANQTLLSDAVLQKGILFQLRAVMEAQRNTLQFTQATLLAATNTSSKRLAERSLAVTERARAAGRLAAAREGAESFLRTSIEQSTGLTAMDTGRTVLMSETDNALREKTKLDANFRVASMNLMMYQFERLNGIRFAELEQMMLLQLASEKSRLAIQTNNLLATFSEMLQAEDALAISEGDYMELKLLFDTAAIRVTQLQIRLGDAVTRYGNLLTQSEQSALILTDMKQSRRSIEQMFMEVLTIVYARQRLAARAADLKATATTNARLKIGARAEKLRKAQLSIASYQDATAGLALVDTNAATTAAVRAEIQTKVAGSDAATSFATQEAGTLNTTLTAKEAAQLAADGVRVQLQGIAATQVSLAASVQSAQEGLLILPTSLASAKESMSTAMNRATQDKAAQFAAGFTATQLELSAASLRATLASLDSAVQQAGAMVSMAQNAVNAAQAAKEGALQAHAQALADATTNASTQLTAALLALEAAKAAYQTESAKLDTLLQSLSQQDMVALATTRSGTMAVANAKLLALSAYEQTVNDGKAAVEAAQANVNSLQTTLNAAKETVTQFESRGSPTKTATHVQLEATLASQQTKLARLAGLISGGLQMIAALTASILTLSVGLGIAVIGATAASLAYIFPIFGSASRAWATAKSSLEALYATYETAMNRLSAIRTAKATLSMYLSSMLGRSTMITQLLAKANFFRAAARTNRDLKNGARKARTDLQILILETEGRVQTGINQIEGARQLLNDTNSKLDQTNQLDLSQLNAIIDATKQLDKSKIDLAIVNLNDLRNKIIEGKLQNDRNIQEIQRTLDTISKLMEMDPSKREQLLKLQDDLKLQLNKLQQLANQLNELLKVLDSLKQLLNQLLNDLTKLKTQRAALNQQLNDGTKLNFGKWIPPLIILGGLLVPLLPIMIRGSFGTTPPLGVKKGPEDPNECARGKADGTKAGLPDGQKAGYLRGYLDAQEAYPKEKAGSLFGLTGMPPPSQEGENNSGPSGPTIQKGDTARLQQLREEQAANEGATVQEGGQVASAIASTEEEQEAQLAPPVEDDTEDTSMSETLADYLLGKAMQGKQTYTRPPDIPVPDRNTIQVAVEGSSSYTQCYIEAYRTAYILGFKQRYYAGFDAWMEELRKYAVSGFARELPITPPSQEEEQEGGGEVEPTLEEDLTERWKELDEEQRVEPTLV